MLPASVIRLVGPFGVEQVVAGVVPMVNVTLYGSGKHRGAEHPVCTLAVQWHAGNRGVSKAELGHPCGA